MGCHMVSMMYINGQTLTVGTEKGMQFLHSHPAILIGFIQLILSLW